MHVEKIENLKRVLFAEDKVNDMNDVIISANMMKNDVSREDMKRRGVKEALLKKARALLQLEEKERKRRKAEEEDTS